MSPNREIITYLKKSERMQFDIRDRPYEIRREMDELKYEDNYLAERFNKLALFIDTRQRAPAGYAEYLQPSSNQETTIYLKKSKQEQSDIGNQRCEIQREMDRLECEDNSLTDCFNMLALFIDTCQRALAGEPIFIWVEIERFKWELEDMRQRIPSLNLDL